MKKFLAICGIILVTTVCVTVGFFIFKPILNNHSNTTIVDTNNNQGDNDNSENNQGDNSNNNNSNTGNNDNNDNNNNDENNDSNNDNANNNNSGNSGSNDNNSGNDNDNEQSGNSGNDNNQNDNNDNNNDDKDNENDNTPTNTYSISIYQGVSLVYSANYKGEIFSNLINGEYNVYTLVIEANYQIESVDNSSNVIVLNKLVEENKITIDFNITSLSCFEFVIDGTTHTFDCIPVKQYSFEICLSKGQSGASVLNNAITLSNINEVSFQITIFEDNIQIPANLTFENDCISVYYGSYYAQVTQNFTVNFCLENTAFCFDIHFVLL